MGLIRLVFRQFGISSKEIMVLNTCFSHTLSSSPPYSKCSAPPNLEPYPRLQKLQRNFLSWNFFPEWTMIRCWMMKLLWRRLRVPSRESGEERGQAELTSFLSSVAGHQVGTKQEAKCLGNWWKSNLGSAKSVKANTEKEIKAFFPAGAIGAYQGTLNPLSSISLFNTCVVPTLLYGSENWILTEQTIARLETFQPQMGKRMLKIPKH